jgi:hypothetical protein
MGSKIGSLVLADECGFVLFIPHALSIDVDRIITARGRVDAGLFRNFLQIEILPQHHQAGDEPQARPVDLVNFRHRRFAQGEHEVTPSLGDRIVDGSRLGLDPLGLPILRLEQGHLERGRLGPWRGPPVLIPIAHLPVDALARGDRFAEGHQVVLRGF